ncbi:MAG: tetratricopeptide repeat protein [Candidatus Heimdallarchaeota archaeon]|nr:tetratricopeptide repeat protein [Candidatus Heimdallarchaeota archaeon]
MTESKTAKELLEKGLEALQQSKNEEALLIFEQALVFDFENSLLWSYKGIALRKLGKYDEAIECYNKALRIDPTSLKALLNKARTLRIQRKYDLALFVYEEILELQPEHEEAKFESINVKSLLSKQITFSTNNQKQDEDKLLEERRNELIGFFDNSRQNISDSVDKIEEIFTSGIKEEGLEHRDRILKAIIAFHKQLIEKIRKISAEFQFHDFEEENRDIIDLWDDYKDKMVKKLEGLK